ncbi:MAG: class III signal peptide-containing protein [Pseudobdellovibrio sp.]
MKFLSNLRNRLRARLLKNNRGQGATEYILLVAVVVGVVMVFRGKIRDQLDKASTKVGNDINQVVNDQQ